MSQEQALRIFQHCDKVSLKTKQRTTSSCSGSIFFDCFILDGSRKSVIRGVQGCCRQQATGKVCGNLCIEKDDVISFIS